MGEVLPGPWKQWPRRKNKWNKKEWTDLSGHAQSWQNNPVLNESTSLFEPLSCSSHIRSSHLFPLPFLHSLVLPLSLKISLKIPTQDGPCFLSSHHKLQSKWRYQNCRLNIFISSFDVHGLSVFMLGFCDPCVVSPQGNGLCSVLFCLEHWDSAKSSFSTLMALIFSGSSAADSSPLPSCKAAELPLVCGHGWWPEERWC